MAIGFSWVDKPIVMISAIYSGLQGMEQGQNQVNDAAFQVSSWGAPAQTSLNPPPSQTPAPSTSQVNLVPHNDLLDLSSAAVNLLQGKDSFQANAKTVHVADEMARQAINLIG